MKQKKFITILIVCVSIISSGCSFIKSPIQPDTEPIAQIRLERIGVYISGAGFDEGGAEMAAYDSTNRKLFSTNGCTDAIDVIDITNPAIPVKVNSIRPSDHHRQAKVANSVACMNGIVVAAVENKEDGKNGFAMLYNTDGDFLQAIEIGVLPDMVTISNNGEYAVITFEGEPYVAGNDTIMDPEGGVSIVDLQNGTARMVRLTSFPLMNGESIRTPLADQLQNPYYLDFEPEYVSTSKDGKTAYVGLQENNAIAVVDISSAALKGLYGLGFKNHNKKKSGLDANKEDETAKIETAPFKALFMPDSIAAYTAADGKTYILTANGGDGRELENSSGGVIYTDLGEVDDLTTGDLSPGYDINLKSYPGKEFLKDMGVNEKGKYRQLYVCGTRSFAIYDGEKITRVFDSGDRFEQYIDRNYPTVFNAGEDNLKLDDRSDDAGPDPERIASGVVDKRNYAFIGLEQFGGVMVYDVTVPAKAQFVTYITGRTLQAKVNKDKEYDDTSYENTGDIAPEGLLFIPSKESPNGTPLLLVSNYGSGILEIYGIYRSLALEVEALAEEKKCGFLKTCD